MPQSAEVESHKTSDGWKGSGTTLEEPQEKHWGEGLTMGVMDKKVNVYLRSQHSHIYPQLLYISDNPREAYPPKRELCAT